MQLILDKSTFYNKNKWNIKFEPKFGKIGLQIYNLFDFLSTIYNFFGPGVGITQWACPRVGNSADRPV